MSVRLRLDEDLPGCVRVLEAVHAADSYPMSWPADPAGWLVPDGLAAAWVAERAGSVVGHVSVVQGAHDLARRAGVSPHRLAAIKRLFVAPPARGAGLGAALLAVASSWAADQDLPVMLDAVGDDGPAVELYERLGWRMVDRRPADWKTPDGHRLPVRIYLAP